MHRTLSTVTLALLALATGLLGPGARPVEATGVVAIAAGAGGEVRAYSCVLTGAGAVNCWGWTPTSDQPEGLDSGIVAVATGTAHACVLTESGAVRCWGGNSYGQLGNGTRAPGPGLVDVLSSPGGTPLTGARAVSAGGYHTCALMLSGEVQCWGRNDFGQLGDGTLYDRLVPTRVNLGDVRFAGVSAGGFHTCGLTTTGAVLCWGDDRFGQLGDGPPKSLAAKPFGWSTNIAAVAAGGVHSCALTTEGLVMCWGRIAGNSGFTSPQQVSGLSSGVAAVTTGGIHTCALMSTGGVKCWGENFEGQLGSGTIGDSLVPVDVVGLDGDVAALSAGGYHTCALLPDGGVKCWGMTYSTVPADVYGLGSGDSDRDGCTDPQEKGPDQSRGGLRNPKSFWDFFDTPRRDRAVSIRDVAAVVARFGSVGDAGIDPLSTPDPPPVYHTAYDRTLPGPNFWNTGAPNGSVTIEDIVRVIAQFGHTCG